MMYLNIFVKMHFIFWDSIYNIDIIVRVIIYDFIIKYKIR